MTKMAVFNGSEIIRFASSADCDKSPLRVCGKSGVEGVILSGTRFSRPALRLKTKYGIEIVPEPLTPEDYSAISGIGIIYVGDTFGFLSYTKSKSIYVSNDGGATFVYVGAGPSYWPLTSVGMSDGGIACCFGGYLRYTYNKGVSFGGSSTVGINQNISFCEKFSTIVGTGSSPALWYSDDFGRTLKAASYTMALGYIQDTAFVTRSGTVIAFHQAYISYTDPAQGVIIARSIDGGKTYTNITIAADHNPNARIVQLASGRLVTFGYKAGDVCSYYSDDDGTTWTKGGTLPAFEDRRWFSAFSSRNKNFLVCGISKEGVYCFYSYDGVTFVTPSNLPAINPSVVVEEGRGIYMSADDTIIYYGRYYSKDYLTTIIDSGIPSGTYRQVQEQDGKVVIYNVVSGNSLIITG